jgi:excinuclease ABC subunit A
MGPEGGAGGGSVVASGTPEEVAVNPESYTGHFLAESLDVPRPKPTKRNSRKASA